MENAADEDWEVLIGLFPDGWKEEAARTGAVERLRGFSSAEMLLRTLLLHVGSGFSLRETALRAKLADWADVLIRVNPTTFAAYGPGSGRCGCAAVEARKWRDACA